MVIQLKTAFPKFEKEELAPINSPPPSSATPSSDLGEVSDYSDTEDKANQYQTKEDQDVAVFLKIAQRMSVKSLLFILQSHARSMHNVIPVQQLENALVSKEDDESGDDSDDEELKSPTRQKRKIKKLRFAEILGGQDIRKHIHEIPHLNTFTAEDKERLWWTQDEQIATRNHAIRVVRHFKQHKPQFVESMTVLAMPDADNQLVEFHMKRLTQTDGGDPTKSVTPRGLEIHIIAQLSMFRSISIKRVMQEQQACRLDSNLSVDDKWARVCGAYFEASVASRAFAATVAACDHIEALKASLSSWGPPQPPQPAKCNQQDADRKMPGATQQQLVQSSPPSTT